MSTIHSLVYAPTQHTSAQLVFGRDATLNINQESNWQLIKQRKHVLIKIKGITKKMTVDYVYHTGVKVLLKNAWKKKFNQDVRTHEDNIIDTYNLQIITTPFKE